jgi:tripartite-type tricarboxylate transporter receptor subunit TctC
VESFLSECADPRPLFLYAGVTFFHDQEHCVPKPLLQLFRFRLLASVVLATTGVLSLVAMAPARAAGYPDKPIHLVIPFPPAGATDVIGRAIGQELSKSLGQPVIVENRPGAGSTIGNDVVAKAAPDGYTLLMASGSICIAANVYSKVSYDVVKSFAPITLVGQVPHVLVANSAVKANTVKELIALARSQPGKLNAASQGNGTLSHMELELFKISTGTDIVHVPYRGSSTVMTDLVAGNVNLFFDSLTSSMPMVKRGNLKALAVLSPQRLPEYPELPTLAEAGVAGFEGKNWFALMAPAGTPPEIVRLLNERMVRILADPALKARMTAQGAILESSTPVELEKLIRDDLSRWATVVKKAGVHLE